MERREPEAFETEIYAKDWDPNAFSDELRAVKCGQMIGIGTATDPYQPAERKFGRTRQALEAMQGLRSVSIFITTKSNLVTRDVDLLQGLSRHNEVGVTITVTTMNRELARKTEPYAPRPDLRIAAVSELSRAGISVGVIANPVLPLITDSEENLEGVAKAAQAAGARQFGANVLFLQPTAQQVFFRFLAERFPEYLARYRRSFASGPYLRGAYPERIRNTVNRIRERVGISARGLEHVSQTEMPDGQLPLF
jgi:DNA repair photolyase